MKLPLLLSILVLGSTGSSFLQGTTLPAAVLFENVRIFDGRTPRLSDARHVLVRGNRIERISATPIPTDRRADTVLVAGEGRTLMPGLIDAHTHIMFATLSQAALLTSDLGFVTVAAARAAEEALLHGFTSFRDMGGPVFGLKRGIDLGLARGPRIWPSGAHISQTGGHGDFRLPTDFPAGCCSFSYGERIGATAIADGADQVLQRTREQLALGASQIKLMAGGGAASHYDPLDVTQYTVPELRAGVEAAANWGTYVTVHAYTPRAIRQAVEAGVKCVEHGQLMDEATARLLGEKGVWLCLQTFTLDRPSAFPEGSPNRLKQLEVAKGTDNAYRWAKQFGIPVAWGSDVLFNTNAAREQLLALARLTNWYSPAEALIMVTSRNAELLALSGPRNPYPGRLGVVEVGALADLLLVDGNPLEDLGILTDPERRLVVVMKDGRIYKLQPPTD